MEMLLRETIDGKNVYRYNGHGDVIAVINEEGEVIASYYYDSFGVEVRSAGSIENPYRYSGEYVDEESGLIYLRYRYYDPSIGRFISEDPIMDGLNWYVYGNNNPIMYIDPWGLAGEKRYVITQSDSLNMRRMPGTHYEIIGSIPRGAEVEYTGYKTGKLNSGHLWAMNHSQVSRHKKAQFL